MKKLFAFLVVISFFLYLVISLENELEISTSIAESVVKEGEKINYPISVLNRGDRQKFSIEYYSEDDFIFLDVESFELEGGKGESLNFIFDSTNLEKGVYTGWIKIIGENSERFIPVVYEVESHSIKFDVVTSISPRFSEIALGDEFVTNVKIYNLKSETGDVHLEYGIKDLSGEVVLSEKQDLNVNNQIELIKRISIPEDIDEGSYVFYAHVKDKEFGYLGSSSLIFIISEEISTSPSLVERDNFILGISFGVIILLIVSFLLINYYWNRRVMNTAKEWRKKVVDIKNIKLGDVTKEIHKLEYQKRLLNKAYVKGYISSASYNEGKKKLNEVILKLKKRL